MTARILMFSQRNFRRQMSRACPYEFEDVVRGLDAVDMIAPPYRFDAAELVDRAIKRLGRHTAALGRVNPGVRPIRVTKRYDLFFMVCQHATDLPSLNALRGWRRNCEVAVCWVDEIWLPEIDRLRAQLTLLREFDHIITGCAHTVEALAAATGRPCSYLPPAVDCRRFHPGLPGPVRSIDVYNMGRRHPATHEALLALARQGRIFYLYDTFLGNVPVREPAEHRSLLAHLIGRSRYFLTNRAKADLGSETAGQEEVGFRFFEGSAAGAVLIGEPPATPQFEENFDWPDAVIRLPFGSTAIGDLLADLDRQPERVAQIRRTNMVNALLRHDWVYRWKGVLRAVGLEPTPAVRERELQLQALAERTGRQAETVAL